MAIPAKLDLYAVVEKNLEITLIFKMMLDASDYVLTYCDFTVGDRHLRRRFVTRKSAESFPSVR